MILSKPCLPQSSKLIAFDLIEVFEKLLQKYENALRLYIDFKEHSKLALVLNILTIILGFGGSVLSNNGIPVMGKIMSGIAVLTLLFFVVVFQKTTSNQSDFYNERK